MELLTQFLLRLSFGLAAGMAVTSPRQVASGFYRNHLYVTLGLTTLAALVATGYSNMVASLAAAAAVCSYAGAVAWLYEAKRFGVGALWMVAALAFLAAWAGEGWTAGGCLPVAASGMLLGMTTAAMLLGHWYLNAPGMELAPLRRLLVFVAIAVAVQALVSAVGVGAYFERSTQVSISWMLFVVLRWSFGLLGVWALDWMAWQTLKIPNTQSATGILYVAVIGVFVGELTGLLLSDDSAFPL